MFIRRCGARARGRLAGAAWGRLVRFGGIAAALLGLLVGVPPGVAAAQTAPARPPLVVSLTFDDGNADQMASLAILARHGLVGTFYVNTGSIDQPDYLTRADLGALAAAGDEIGGHTVSHANLPTDAADETARQICNDRATLTSWGFDPVSFAYPFGAYTPAVQAAAQACGYTSARKVGGIGANGPVCPGCVPSETVPPLDPYAVRTAAQVTPRTTLSDLQQAVRTGQTSGGGWIPFIFHHETCDAGCGALSNDPALLDAFASWLAGQQQAGTVLVRTVGQVINRPAGPAHRAPAATSPTFGNGDLAAGAGTLPDCWQSAGYGTNTANYRWAPAVGGQPAAETVSVSAYTDGDATMLPRLDLGQCSAVTSPTVATTLSARYHSTVVTQFAVYRRNGAGAWAYWTSSPYLPPASGWAQATWTTPPAPPDTTGLAAGLTVGAVGSVTSTDYRVAPVAPVAPVTPVTPIATQVALPAAPAPQPPTNGNTLLLLGAAAVVALALLTTVIGFARRRRRRTPHDPAWGPARLAAPPYRKQADDTPTGVDPTSDRPTGR